MCLQYLIYRSLIVPLPEQDLDVLKRQSRFDAAYQRRHKENLAL